MTSFTSAQSSKLFSRNLSYLSDVPMYRGAQRMGEYKFQENLHREETSLTLKNMHILFFFL